MFTLLDPKLSGEDTETNCVYSFVKGANIVSTVSSEDTRCETVFPPVGTEKT
jgi:hypothetical protein